MCTSLIVMLYYILGVWDSSDPGESVEFKSRVFHVWQVVESRLGPGRSWKTTSDVLYELCTSSLLANTW